MINLILIWVMIILCIEAITELIVDADIFFNVRDWLSQKSNFLGKLLNCGYCVSVWVSFPFALVAPGIIFKYDTLISIIFLMDLLVKWMILHRLSNLVHELIVRLLQRIPFTFVIHKIEPEDNNEFKRSKRVGTSHSH